MQEDFLHYIWKLQKFNNSQLKTTNNEFVELISVGQHNLNSGPDFFNSQLKIDNQFWAGNIEIHVKSSDWYVHNHELDSAYDNVILHVVWEHDTEVFRKNNTEIPTLELKNYVSKNELGNYQKLISNSDKWINCEQEFNSINDFTINNWLERLYFERLERKSTEIKKLLISSTNNWEEVLFKMLAKNFGLKVNGEAFLSVAKSIDFSVLRKSRANLMSLESLFFGQAGFLDDNFEEPYFSQLKHEYAFLKQKFNLSNNSVIPSKFFRLRPSNFPTIRLSQLACLYYEHHNIFSKVIEASSIEDFYNLFKVGTTSFWESHYTFNLKSKESKKVLTKPFIELLLINTIIPIKFSYEKQLGKINEESILKLIEEIPSEKNRIIQKFNDIKSVASSALQTQALIQLKNEYCDKNKCLQCAIGNDILTRNC